jgi:predicted exporter
MISRCAFRSAAPLTQARAALLSTGEKSNPTLTERYPRASKRRRPGKAAPSKAEATPSQPASAQASKDTSGDEWVNSNERTEQLTTAERWVMKVAVLSSMAAIAGFTLNKWEIERRLEELSPEDQQRWRDGSFKEEAQRRATAEIAAAEVRASSSDRSAEGEGGGA